MIMVFGALVLNDDISRYFFHIFEIFVFWAVKGVKGRKNKNHICHAPYLRNIIAYDHDFWYTCVK